MIEAQRLAYLEAMGVDSYMPRRLLTLAPEPLLCETLTIAPAADVADARNETTVADAQAAVGLVDGDEAQSKARPRSAPQASPQERERPAFDWADETAKPTAKSPQAGRSNAPTFKLRASIAVSNQAWLIADASPSPLSASQMMPWSAQLIRAMTGQAGESRCSVFNWPPPRTQSLAVTEAEACESFSAMLTGALERDQVRYVLLLGEAMREWVLPPELQVIRGPSIAEMRKNPEAKAMLWQSMRRFLRTLG